MLYVICYILHATCVICYILCHYVLCLICVICVIYVVYFAYVAYVAYVVYVAYVADVADVADVVDVADIADVAYVAYVANLANICVAKFVAKILPRNKNVVLLSKICSKNLLAAQQISKNSLFFSKRSSLDELENIL